MKVLHVSGDDYAAVAFERGGDTSSADLSKEDLHSVIKQKWEESNAAGKTIWSEDDYISCRAYEFGEVDEKFIEFIRNEIQDYDDSKHSNFYVLEEE